VKSQSLIIILGTLEHSQKYHGTQAAENTARVSILLNIYQNIAVNLTVINSYCRNEQDIHALQSNAAVVEKGRVQVSPVTYNYWMH